MQHAGEPREVCQPDWMTLASQDNTTHGYGAGRPVPRGKGVGHMAGTGSGHRMLLVALLLVVLGVPLLCVPAQAQVVRAFTPRFTTSEPGDILLIGNTLMSCTKSAGSNPNPPGSCAPSVPDNGTGSPLTNGDYTMGFINVAEGTTNSSSADLMLPPGAIVRWAGLYWGARHPSSPVCANTSPLAPCRRVRLATPTTPYATRTGTVDVEMTTNRAYQGFVEVTLDVQAGGSGTYRVADVAAATGQEGIGFYAGWALIVVVHDPLQPLRNLTVFDGFARVTPETRLTSLVQGFVTPAIAAFTARMGAVVYDGDRSFIGDTFQLNGVNLTNAANPSNDAFNSTISRLGVPVTTKNPNFVNQLGLDIDTFEATGILPPRTTRATLLFSNPGENTFPGVLTFAIEVFQPVIEGHVTKTVVDLNGGTLVPGDILAYSLSVTNTGNDAAIDLVLDDPIPFNTTYVPNSIQILTGPNAKPLTDALGDDQGEFTGSSIRVRLGTGANEITGGRLDRGGASTELTFQVQVNAGTAAGTVLTNQATTTYTGETLGTPFTSPSDGDFVTPGPQPTPAVVGPAQAALALTKSATPNPVVAGQPLTYTLTVTNTGPSNAADVRLTDPLPAATLFQSAVVPTGWSLQAPAVGATGTVTFSHPSLPPGTATLTLVVLVQGDTPSGTAISNTASVASPTDVTGPHMAATTVPVVRPQDLVLAKTVPPLTGQGQELTYTLTVTNPGPDNGSTVVVTDATPPNTTFLRATAPTGWVVTEPAVGGGAVTFAHPLLPPGTATLTFVVLVNTGVLPGTVLKNTATVTSPNDPNPTNNTATAQTTLSGPGVTKSFSPNPVSPGVPSTLTLVLTNPHALILTGATFTDTYPAGLTNANPPAATTTCGGTLTTPTESSVRLTDGTISAGGMCTVTVQVITASIGSRTNTIPAGGLTTTNGGTNTAPANAILDTLLSPTVVKAFTPTATAAGGTATLRLTLTNPNAGLALLGARLTDQYPAGMVNASPPNATTTCTGGIAIAVPGASTLRLVGGTIPGGGSCTVQVTVTAAGGTYTNTLPSGGLITDNGGANVAPADAMLSVALSPPTIAKAFAPASISAGQPSTLRVTMTNTNSEALTGVAVQDPLPPGVQVAAPLTFNTSGCGSPTFAPTVGATTLAFAAGTIDPGSTCTFTVQVTGVVGGAAVNTTGAVTSTNGGPGGTATATLTVAPVADLTITKNSGAASVVPGAAVPYTIVVTNQGPSAVTGASVSDLGLTNVTWTCVASAGSHCPASGSGVLNALVNLAVGGTATFSVQTLVNPDVQGTITNTTTVALPTGVIDPTPDTNTASVTLPVAPVADIAVTKTVNNATPTVGATVTFTVTVTNLGPDDATGVQFVDRVPTGLTLLTATPSPGTSYTAATGVWDVGHVAVGTQVTLTLATRVDQAEEITNVAARSKADQFDPKSSNNTAGVTLSGEPSADIQVHKTVDTPLPNVGSVVTFTVTATNAGPSPATGVQITDALPAGLLLGTATPSQGTYTAATGVWDLGALAVGASATLTLPAAVQHAGRLTNRAAKTAQVEPDPVPSNDVSGATINGQEADVQVLKTVDQPAPLVGQTVTFTVTVTNNGPSAATDVEVVDLLPAGLTLLTATPSQGSYTAATSLWAVGTLASTGPGATATLLLTATVTQAGPLRNLAVKTAQQQPDPNPANDFAGLQLVGQPSADLVLTKTDGVTSVVPGTTVTSTLVVTNRGPSAVIGALVIDAVPASLTNVSWTCTALGGAACPASGTGDILALVDLPLQASVTFLLQGTVAPDARGTLENTASVIAPSGVTDPLVGNNSGSDTDLLLPQSNLGVTKTDSGTIAVPGQPVTYTLVVTNAGPSRVTGATVRDVVPAALRGVTWTCVASVGSACLATGTGTIDTTVDLAVGGTVTFTLTGTVAPEATGTLENTVTVEPPTGVMDPTPPDNTHTDQDTLTPRADLAITKLNLTGTVAQGGATVYLLGVTNHGPSAVVGAIIDDPLPAGLLDFAWVCTAVRGARCPDSGTGALAVPVDLPPGGIALLLVKGVVSAAATGAVTNQATIRVPGGATDPVASNNTAVQTELVTPTADLVVTKTLDNHTPLIGDRVTFTVTVSNQGPSVATGVRLSDPVPGGLTFLEARVTAGTYDPATGVLGHRNSRRRCRGDSDPAGPGRSARGRHECGEDHHYRPA